MSRERDRIAKQREKNAAVECNKIQKKFYPELFSRFEKVKDPRHQSYITYSCKEMLGTLYYKGIAGISSMQRMTREFNSEDVVGNPYRFMEGKKKEYLPHGVTEKNVLEYTETKGRKEEKVTTEFAWTTNFEITAKNAQKLVNAGRNRWKIENQGFNRQKNWQGDIEHACSWNEKAQKNHYLMEQISDFIKQLYEYFYLKKNEIKKVQKNISSELLVSFGWHLTETEDINTELHNAVLN